MLPVRPNGSVRKAIAIAIAAAGEWAGRKLTLGQPKTRKKITYKNAEKNLFKIIFLSSSLPYHGPT